MSVLEILTPHQQSLIEEHLRLVIAANEKVNLTRIDSYDEGMLLHVEDSLAGLQELNAAPQGLYGDLGSGGGFPGIPLAVASGRETMLIDARRKKMDVVDDIVEQLGLSTQITTYAGRAELLARKRLEEFSVLTVRALSQLAVLLELASPLLMHGGVLICYKAHLTDDEFAHARRIRPQVGMELVNDRSFMLNGEYQRRILTFEKVAEPKMKLPRQEGLAQKKPL